MVVFTLFLILACLILAGMSVDIMRFEAKRTQLQAVVDRCVLAAADLEQKRSPEQVVRDCAVKAGLSDDLKDVDVNQAINMRRVGAHAEARVGSMFLGAVGIPSMTVPVTAIAEESARDIEIVLVLDVSFSMVMNGSRRLANLQVAATDFINSVLAGDRDGRISISIVPFNGQVNLGQRLFNALRGHYTVTNQHGLPGSYCIDLPDAAFAQTSIPTGLQLPQAGFFDSWGNNGTRNTTYRAPLAVATAEDNPWAAAGSAFPTRLVPVCRVTEPGNVVQIPTRDAAALRSRISALDGAGFTSIQLGLKWGLLMLDPSFRTVLTTAGLPSGLGQRPFDFGRPNTQKIIVLMTDGENQASHFLLDGFRNDDPSPIYRSADNVFSFKDASRSTNPYWIPSTGTWAAVPANNGTQQTWTQVWQNARMTWVAWQLYARRLCTTGTTTAENTCRNNAYFRAITSFRGPNTPSTGTATDTLDAASADELTRFAPPMDTQVQQTCRQAIAAGVIIYGIAFEAPTKGQQTIRNCVTDNGRLSAANYYNAQGLQIQTAFRSIAAQINSLRLRR